MFEISFETAFQRSGISEDQRLILERNSKGLYGLDEFVALAETNPAIRGSIALGLDHPEYRLAVDKFDLVRWQDARDMLGDLRRHGYIRRFMDVIADNKRAITFFVPPNVLTHPSAHVTKGEFLWSLQNPHRIGSFYFVFGLNDYPGFSL